VQRFGKDASPPSRVDRHATGAVRHNGNWRDYIACIRTVLKAEEKVGATNTPACADATFFRKGHAGQGARKPAGWRPHRCADGSSWPTWINLLAPTEN
jgi:hypothetical protein